MTEVSELSLPPEAAGPDPGQPGHFAHHDWLTASVKDLDTRIPFAMACGQFPVPAPGGTNNPSAVVTFPTGRFVVIPAALASVNTGSLNLFTNPAPVTLTSLTVTIVHKDVGQMVPANAGYPVAWAAFQMTAASPSVRQPSLTEADFTATCDTPGCGNEGVDIVCTYDTEVGVPGAVFCGVCGAPIVNNTLLTQDSGTTERTWNALG